MMLRLRAVVTALIVAVPVGLGAFWAVERLRARDLELALTRVVRSQVNDQVRERCESDPNWFLTGPLEGRPKRGDIPDTHPDALPPRPKTTPQPFELFAYDEQFTGSSTAAPRFPNEFRRALQSGSREAVVEFDAPDGTGVQMAIATGWIASPCMYLLGRMAPPPDQVGLRVRALAIGFLAGCLAALAAAAPMVMRVRRLSRLAQASKADGYSTIALDKGKDELNAVTFVYNDAAEELRLRKARIDDLDAGLRRFVQATELEIIGPLQELEREIAGSPSGGAVLRDAHDLASKVENLIAAARLRASGSPIADAPVPLNAVVDRVVARHRPVARAAGVSIDAPAAAPPVTIDGDEALIERAISNVVDNAIRYNTAGGRVVIALSPLASAERFRLVVSDTGRGVTEEELKTLTAIRRFRGDEGRIRRPGAPGLGLAVTREAADRSSLVFELRRRTEGGLEAEFRGRG